MAEKGGKGVQKYNLLIIRFLMDATTKCHKNYQSVYTVHARRPWQSLAPKVNLLRIVRASGGECLAYRSKHLISE